MAISPPNPTKIRAGRLGGENGPSYIVYSVSPKVDQDAEFWVEFDYELIQPGTTLLCDGTQTYNQIMADNRFDGPIPEFLGLYVLMDIQTLGGKNYLVFARNTLPTAQYYANPSDQWKTRKTWEFPAIMRKFPAGAPDFQADIISGNLVNVIVNPDIVGRYTGPCTIVVSKWWTSKFWSQAQMEINLPMITELVEWDYKGLAQGSGMFLHGPIFTPPISGITKIRGQSIPPSSVQGKEFFPTNVETWVDDVEDDDQVRVRGRVYREQRLVLVPYDPNSRQALRTYSS